MSDVPRLFSWFETGELVRPSGDTPNLVDLSLAVAHLCGTDAQLTASARRIADAIGPAEHLVFVLVDGFGMNLLEREPDDSPFRRGFVMELATVYPSSTAPALTSLATGAWPAEHAVPGWWTYLPDADVTATILPFNERFSQRPLEVVIEPERAFPLPSQQSRFTRRRLAVSPKQISGSIYSMYSQAEPETAGYASITLGAERVADFVRGADGPTYTYFYVPFIDATEHTRGHNDAQVAQVVAQVRDRVGALVEAVDGRARVVVTADHGHVEVGDDEKHFIARGDALCALLRIPPSCEPRAPAFHVRPGAHERFAGSFRDRYGGRFALLSIDEADGLRLFGRGPLSEETRRRLGDFVAVARGHDAIAYEPTPELRVMRGFHGGLTPDEMRIPLIIL